MRREWMVLLGFAFAWPVWSDVVVFHEPFRGERTVEGNLIAEGSDGEIVIETPDGRHWEIEKPFIRKWDKSLESVPMLDRKGLVESLRREYGGGFKILESKNYIIVYGTSDEFAEEAARLFERIKTVFENYIRRQAGFEPAQPKQPMIAVIFASDDDYIQGMKDEIGIAAFLTAGVYIPASNRMYMYDMFGGRDEEWVRFATMFTGKSADELAFLFATENISTVIHEGTHQVAFNTGFHDRKLRNPLWLVEGLACLMEVPKIDSKRRWSGVDQINWDRLDTFREHYSRLPTYSVHQVVTDDMFMRESDTADLGYALSWAVSYYLTKARKKEYMEYVKLVNARPPVETYSEEARVEDFRKAFGETPEQMEAGFRRYMERNVMKKRRPVKR